MSEKPKLKTLNNRSNNLKNIIKKKHHHVQKHL